MKKHYVTFGQAHTHNINGKTLDFNTVAVFEANTASEGRQKAFDLFGRKFCFEYHDTKWNENDMHYYPKGYVYL